MTPAGQSRLREELQRLREVDAPQASRDIGVARDHGDLSENAEYHAAREKQGLLEARSKELKNMISLAREIRPEIVRTDAVSVGARVRLRDALGEETEFSLLGPADVDVARNVINYQTPLAQSLMNRKRGETVTLEVLGHKHVWTVLDISSAV